MSEKEPYSVYIAHFSNASQVYSLLAGFTFTAITILLTLLPDPSQIIAQVTLFFLAVLFSLCLFMINSADWIFFYSTRVAPPTPEAFTRRTDFVEALIWIGAHVPPILLFLLSNLTYLALVTSAASVLILVSSFIHIMPILGLMRRFEAETGKKWCIRKFFDERDVLFKGED